MKRVRLTAFAIQTLDQVKGQILNPLRQGEKERGQGFGFGKVMPLDVPHRCCFPLCNFLKYRKMMLHPLIEEPLTISLRCDLEEVLVQGAIAATPNVNSK